MLIIAFFRIILYDISIEVYNLNGGTLLKPAIIGVLGLGVFGRTIAKQAGRFGREVIAIDLDQHNVDLVANEVTTATVGDFTDYDLLEDIGIANCDVVIVATGTNLESAVLAVMHCKRLGVPNIIAKAHSAIFEQALKELGATKIISPERDSGKRLASQLLRKHIGEILTLDDNTSVVEFSVPEKWVGKSILGLDLRKNYDMNIIGYRPRKGAKMVSNLNIQSPIVKDMIFVAITDSHTFEEHDYLDRIN